MGIQALMNCLRLCSVRYSRVGRIRKQLGFNGQIEHYPGQEKVIFDQDYLACDIVINWAADGLVLCFMHAVVGMLLRLSPNNLPYKAEYLPFSQIFRHKTTMKRIELLGQTGVEHQL